MKTFRALLFLGICLGLQAGLARLLPASARYVDMMVLPVVWYAVRGSQRSALLAGCAGGLMQDGWFEAGVFGMTGFSKTFLGWLVGGLASRVDLNGFGLRFSVGAVFTLAQSVLEIGLRRLLDQTTWTPQLWEWILKAAVTGAIVAIGFPLVDRFRGAGRSGYRIP